MGNEHSSGEWFEIALLNKRADSSLIENRRVRESLGRARRCVFSIRFQIYSRSPTLSQIVQECVTFACRQQKPHILC